MHHKINPGIFNHSDTCTEVSPFFFFSVSGVCWIANLNIKWAEVIDNVIYGTLEWWEHFSEFKPGLRGSSHLCFPGFNWGLGLCYSSSGDAPVWALHGLQFLQDISICSSPVLSRGHSVYVFFSPWNIFSSFFTDLEVHSAFSSFFSLHFSASWCFFWLLSMFSEWWHQL